VDLRLSHKLGRAGALARLVALARKHEVEVQLAPDGASGELSKSTPFGAARARFECSEDALELTLIERPPMLPASMVLRALREKLEELLRDPAGS
jgi:hypothetical protein